MLLVLMNVPKGTWVVLLGWKIFSEATCVPQGLRRLRRRLPPGSAWSEL